MKPMTLLQAIKFQPSKGRIQNNYCYTPDRFKRSLTGGNVLQRYKPNFLRTLVVMIVRTIKWHLN